MGQRTGAWTKVLTDKTEKQTYGGEIEEGELKNLVTDWTWGTGEKTQISSVGTGVHGAAIPTQKPSAGGEGLGGDARFSSEQSEFQVP